MMGEDTMITVILQKVKLRLREIIIAAEAHIYIDTPLS